MSAGESHEELQELLPAAALDILEPTDLARVLRHVRHCAKCEEVLEDYRGVTAALGLLLPSRRLDPARSASLRATLLARARGSREPTSPRSTPVEIVVQRSGRGAWLAGRWAGWTVAAGLAGVVLMHHAIHRPLDYGWLVAGGLLLLLVVLGLYASIQVTRVSTLTERLVRLSRDRGATSASGETSGADSSSREP